MYVRVLQDELQFPDDRAIDQDTKSLIRGVSLWKMLILEITLKEILFYYFCSCFNEILPFECVSLESNGILIFL
jgi:hypothetical protein